MLTRPRRSFPLRTLGAVVVLALVLAAAFFWRPTLFFHARDRLSMWRHGIAAEDVRLGPYRIHYLVAGSGRPLVLVHGLGGSSAEWLATIPEYTRRGFRVYAPDLLGHGGSDTPDVDYSISRQVTVLRQFLDALGIRRPDVVGISMGGWTSVKLAAEDPERLRHLVLLDSAGMTMPVDEARGIAATLVPRTPEQLQQLMDQLTVNPPRLPGFIARDLLRLVSQRQWVVRRALASMLTGADVMDGRLQAVRVPVLLVWGRKDAITPLRTGEAMHRELPRSVLRVLDGCGHVAAYACRAEVTPIVAEFLETR